MPKDSLASKAAFEMVDDTPAGTRWGASCPSCNKMFSVLIYVRRKADGTLYRHCSVQYPFKTRAPPDPTPSLHDEDMDDLLKASEKYLNEHFPLPSSVTAQKDGTPDPEVAPAKKDGTPDPAPDPEHTGTESKVGMDDSIFGALAKLQEIDEQLEIEYPGVDPPVFDSQLPEGEALGSFATVPGQVIEVPDDSQVLDDDPTLLLVHGEEHESSTYRPPKRGRVFL